MPNGSFDLDVAAEKKKLLSFFQLRTIVSSYSRSVLDANLFDPRFGEKPDWYDSLVGHLGATQAQCQRWFDTVAPPMTALPQVYINFANGYSSQMPRLRAAMESLISNHGANGDKDLQIVTTIFNQLLTGARAQSAVLTRSNSDLQAYLSDLTQAIKGLTDGAATVNSAIQIEKEAIVDTLDAIASLQAQLQADIRAVIGSSVTAFVGLIGMIVAIVVAVANPIAGAVAGAVVGGLVLAGGVIATALTAVSVVNDQKAILSKQNELSAESQQVVLLNGLALTLKGLLDAYQQRDFKLDGLTATWSTLDTNLEQVRDLIIAERTDREGLKAVLADLQDLDAMLSTLTQFATELQNAALEGDATPIRTVTIPTDLAA